jgi:hypothetical protein
MFLIKLWHFEQLALKHDNLSQSFFGITRNWDMLKCRKQWVFFLYMLNYRLNKLEWFCSFQHHNLCYKYLNGSCEAIFDIYTLRPFKGYKEHFNARCFDPYNQALSFWESRRTPSSHFWECEFHPHTCLKVGLRHNMFNLNVVHYLIQVGFTFFFNDALRGCYIKVFFPLTFNFIWTCSLFILF